MPGAEDSGAKSHAPASTNAARKLATTRSENLGEGNESEPEEDLKPPARNNLKESNGGGNTRKLPRSSIPNDKRANDCDETLSEIVDNSPTTKNQNDETSSSGDHSEQRTDEAKRIPIREILTPPRRLPVRRKKELDSNTLDLFKTTLSESKGDNLDEDEVMHFATRLYRNADQQATYQKSMTKHPGTGNDSGSESDDSLMFAECLAEEEEYAIGNEQFKKIVSTINKKTAGSASKSQSSGFKMDRRTLSWIKGGSGILRTDKHYLAKGRVNTRRRARKQFRQLKRPNKEMKGLDVLCEAIEEVEIDHGPFPKAVRRTAQPKRRYDADDEQTRRKSAKKSRVENKSEATALKKRAAAEASDLRPTKRRQLPRQFQKSRRFSQSLNLDIDICTDLKELSNKWKDLSDAMEETPPLENEFSFRRRSEKLLHPKLVAADVRHRLPSLDTFRRLPVDLPEKIAPGVYGPPRNRHTDTQYASMCSRLLNMVSKMRVFVMAEFFYSDIDREWYNHDLFGSQLTKLGVKPDQVVTLRQWKAIRRLIRQKPRRFSPSFIASQLNERNMYRCTVRRLQNSPHLATPAGFPFHVYAPIPVGATVTAYCKYFRMLQRGKVLAYDKSSAVYFIEFEGKQFGYEMCPDADVATSGVPRILLKAPPTKFINRREDSGAACGTATGALLDKPHHATPLRFRNRVGDELINYDTFLELIDVLDEARERRREALAVLHDCSEEDLGLTHYDWLRGYLGATQAVIKKSLDILRVLFGGLYRNSEASTKRDHARKLIGKYLESHSATDMSEKLMTDWTDVVNQRTKEIASAAQSAVEQMPDGERDRAESVSATLRKSLESCGQAIVLAKFASLTAKDKMGSTESLAILKKVTDELCEHKYPEASNPCHIYSGFVEARNQSVAELKESLTMLECEVRLARVYSQHPLVDGGEATADA